MRAAEDSVRAGDNIRPMAASAARTVVMGRKMSILPDVSCIGITNFLFVDEVKPLTSFTRIMRILIWYC